MYNNNALYYHGVRAREKAAAVYSYRRGRYGFIVFNSIDNSMLSIGIPTRVRAQYVCAVLNQTPDINTYFKFGDL